MNRLDIEIHLLLDRFALRVEVSCQGPVTGIFGPSGAGKTGLLEAIAGLRPEVRGRIALGDVVWLDSDAGRFVPIERREIGYVPQEGLLFPHLDVRENLLAGGARALGAGESPDEQLAAVAQLLELEPLLERSVGSLSGGERQRVALGRALCSSPRLLLLDEPLASLDLPLRRRLLPHLRRVREELTVPMLLVSHDPIEVQALCDELVVLDEGRVVAHGEPHRALSDPEVFSLARREGFENVLAGRLERLGAGEVRVRLQADGAERTLTVGDDGTPEGPVLVGLPASDVLIATEPPTGLSARNTLTATVEEIRSLDGVSLVVTRFGPEWPPLTVEVTPATPARLGFAAGDTVHLVVKAASCRLYS